MSFKFDTIIFFSISIFYLFLIIFFWDSISIPSSNKNNVIGTLTLKEVNPINDTIRFFLFTGPVFLLTYIYLKLNFKDKFVGIISLCDNQELRNNNLKLKDVIIFKLLFIIFITLEFLSLNFSDYTIIDSLHDGDYLTPLKNYQYSNGLWSSSFVIHVGRDLFIPILASKVFGSFNIAPIKISYIFCIFLIKLFSIILSFHLSRITDLPKNYKIVIFFLSSIFLLSLSDYAKHDYLNYRDLFVIIFFIFFCNLILSKKSIFLSYFLTLTSVIAFYFHYDTGVYLLIILFIYFLYLLISNNYSNFIIILFFLILNFFLSILFFGLNEIINFYDQFTQIILNIDKIHGLEYPKPFFSIGKDADGARATKLLVFFVLVGFFINYTIFLKKKFLNSQEKILILFIYLYSLISYKNALGRSDGGHMMLSSDWITIIIFYFSLFYFIFLISQKIKQINVVEKVIKILPMLFIIFTIFQFKDNNIIKSFDKIQKYVTTPNSQFSTNFATSERKKILMEISDILEEEVCINNFTVDLSIPYLLNKPTCSKFFSSWIASGKKTETEYINYLKKEKSKYIIYTSPHFLVDEIPTNKRLKFVDNYITQNYFEVFNYKDYSIVKKKD